MTVTRSLKEKVIKGSLFAILFSFFGSTLAYFIRILYSRTLSVESYGLFYAVFGFFSIISTYTDLGFGEAIAYFVPKYFKSRKYKKLWNTFLYGQMIQVGTAVLLSIVLVIMAPFLSSKYFKVEGSETLIYIFSAFLIINSILNGLSQIFTGLQKIKYYSSINVLRTILVLSFSLFFLISGFHSPVYYALSWVFGCFIAAIFFLYLLWIKHPAFTKNSLSWDKEIFNAMYNYALPAFVTTFIYSLLISSDIFFLTLFKGVKEVGLYNIIVPIASISVIFLSPLNLILFPLISHLMEGEKEKIGYLVSNIYQIVPFIGVYFALFIILFPSSTISLIFGQKWLDFSELPLSFLSSGYIVLLMSNILGIIVLSIGKVKERLKVFVLMTVLGICLNSFLIWKYGILGAVATNSLVASILCIIFTRIIKTTIFFKIPYLFYIKLLFFSIFIFSIVRIVGFSPKNWLEFIFSGLIYSILFIFLGFLLKVYDRELLKLMLPLKSYNA